MNADSVLLIVIVSVCFGGALLLLLPVVFLHYRGEARKQQLAHEERMRALENGQPLPDLELARAAADTSRARAVGAIGALVPLAALGAAAGVSVSILERPFSGTWEGLDPTTTRLLIVWLAAGAVSVVAVSLSLVVLRHLPKSVSRSQTSGPDEAGEAAAKEPTSALRA